MAGMPRFARASRGRNRGVEKVVCPLYAPFVALVILSRILFNGVIPSP